MNTLCNLNFPLVSFPLETIWLAKGLLLKTMFTGNRLVWRRNMNIFNNTECTEKLFKYDEPSAFWIIYDIFKEHCAIPSVWGQDHDLRSVRKASKKSCRKELQHTESCVRIRNNVYILGISKKPSKEHGMIRDSAGKGLFGGFSVSASQMDLWGCPRLHQAYIYTSIHVWKKKSVWIWTANDLLTSSSNS